jgi:hypothetical protein
MLRESDGCGVGRRENIKALGNESPILGKAQYELATE